MVLGCFFLDFIFQFFQEYSDLETFEKIRDHKQIAKRYAYSGWLFLDFFSTFPFDSFAPQMLTLRLIRLLRLTKLVRLLDVNRVLRLVKGYYDKSGGEDRLQSQYSVMLSYKIFRLTLIAMMTTYFIGSFWYYLSDKINSIEDKMQ